MRHAPIKANISARAYIMWGLAVLFFMYEFFLRTFLGSIAQQIMASFKLSLVSFAMVDVSYLIAFAAMLVPAGMLIDRLGIRKTMTCATLTCALSTLAFAQTSHFYIAWLSHFLTGIGSAFAFIAVAIIARAYFPQKHFALILGVSQCIATIGPILSAGPLVTWIMMTYDGQWRPAVTVIGYAGVALAALILWIVRSQNTHPITSHRPTNNLADTTLPLRDRLKKLLQEKNVWVMVIYGPAIYAPIALMGAVWGTTYLLSGGLPQTTAANIISIAWLGYALGCPLLGAISDQIGSRKPTMLLACLIGFCSSTWIVYAPPMHSALANALLFFMLGIAASGINDAFVMVAECAGTSLSGTAVGLLNASITLLNICIPPLVGWLTQWQDALDPKKLHANHFTLGLSIMPILYIIALGILCFCLQDTESAYENIEAESAY